MRIKFNCKVESMTKLKKAYIMLVILAIISMVLLISVKTAVVYYTAGFTFLVSTIAVEVIWFTRFVKEHRVNKRVF